ncbi:MAG: hypothetical protein EB078_09800 [Proteobacteria bacterium]|nr:hypothetical protein [Pseudomonadota bacterium]NDC25785.1 hypothetical protein [Pseudomonadota bacterium]NDD05187.1 hypothetical protein [Pseudomonadota bacterium]
MKNKGIRGFVTQVTPVSSALTKVTFRLSEGLKYQPGQSVWLEVTRSYGSAVASQRFALCGDPVQAIRTNSYEVLAHSHSANGVLCGLGKIKVGDLLRVEGPVGSFNIADTQSSEDVVWLATPSGLGPFLAFIQSESFQKNRPKRTLLLVEAYRETEIAFQALFESKGVTVIPCVTQPDEWIQGFWGKAISLLKSKKFQLDFSRARFFVSAGEGVSEEVVKMLTEEKGVRREQIAKDILHARLTSSQNQAGLWIPVELVTEEENEELLQQDYPEISRAA